jgi:DNA polymerase III delta prime subunit
MDLPYIYKYKPSCFSDFEIDPDIIDILKTLISMNNLNLLFIGDSGSGKTSLIKVLVNEYYGNTSKYHENILEINSLKEQGIQYYRSEVKTFCQTRCTIPNKKKIVILDDIDNINEQSQQVFRNCIDKYNNNVHFISSCTNVQKVIDSLQSRKIIIKLKSLSDDQIYRILYKVKTNEGIVIDDDAEKFILTVCNGSIRILLNYLEKFKLLDQRITFELANDICTNISFSLFQEYTTLAIHNDLLKCVQILYHLFDKGYSVMDIYDNYFAFVKITELISEDHKYKIIKLLCKYITIFHNIHEDEIELALFTNNLIEVLSN